MKRNYTTKYTGTIIDEFSSLNFGQLFDISQREGIKLFRRFKVFQTKQQKEIKLI